MQDLNDLYYFVHIVEHAGFAPAGRALGIPKSKLSRRIAQLEERLGVRLIQRTTRQFAVTELGHTYYEHCKAMLIEAEAAQAVIDETRVEPRGVIRMTCPTALLQVHVADILADFMVQCPQVTIHLEATNRRVDVVSEAVDLALRVRPPPLADSELVMRILAERSQCLVASPQLLAGKPTPHSPAELNDWPSLGLGTPQESYTWTLYNAEHAQAIVHHTPRLVTSDMQALRTAALAGVGVVQLPCMMVREQLAAGRLIKLVPDWSPRKEVVHAVFPTRRGLLPSVRSVIDYLVLRFAEIDENQCD